MLRKRWTLRRRRRSSRRSFWPRRMYLFQRCTSSRKSARSRLHLQGKKLNRHVCLRSRGYWLVWGPPRRTPYPLRKSNFSCHLLHLRYGSRRTKSGMRELVSGLYGLVPCSILIFSGRSNGVVAVLHGPRGSGKRYMAERIAETYKIPLLVSYPPSMIPVGW